MVKQKLRDQKAKLTFWTLKNTIVRKDEKDSRNDKKEEFCYIHVHAGYNHKLPMRSLKFFKVFLQLFAEQNSKVLMSVFENHKKSLIQHCERSELRLHFEWTKVY